MRIKIETYSLEPRVFSLALNEKIKLDLEKSKLDFIYVLNNQIIIFPEKEIISEQEDAIDFFMKCNNYDVFESYEDGTFIRVYDNTSDENTFFITEKCNSNCIMCPMPEECRRRGNTSNIETLIEIANHIPDDIDYITITGGEPFIVGKKIFELLEVCRDRFNNTDFQILTNGRIFAIKEYCNLLIDKMPNYTTIGIPIHGSCEEVHDMITQSPKSFNQTLKGIKNLLKNKVNIEIRIVISKLNIMDISNISELIVNEINDVNHICIMAMEMTGSAYTNREKIWIGYKEAFKEIKSAIDNLINAGINVRLYNFPLCTVEDKYRTLCCRSISSWKVRYGEVCDKCRLKELCCGVFAGTILLESGELEAIV